MHRGRFVQSLALAFVVAFVAGCAVPVAAALDEPDANRVVVALDQSGIDSSKEADPTAEGKFRVTVARDDVGRALAAMREEELPRPKTRGVLDAADRGQLVPSQAAEHAQLVAGLAGELEKTLGTIDGVLAARVHLNLPPREPLRDGPPHKATASVLVEHRGTTPPLAPESIQRLVAGGAPGVAPTDVSVIFIPRTARAGGGRTDLAHVGPITVARGSMNTLKLAFASLVVIVLALAGTTLGLWSKIARMRRDRDRDRELAQRTHTTGITAATTSSSLGPSRDGCASSALMIAIQSVSKSFRPAKGGPPNQVLKGVSLHVPASSLYGLIGPGAAGKSILLKMIVGLMKPDVGTIVVDGVDVTAASELDLQKMRLKFGMLFQNNALFDHMSVGDNIAFPLRRLTDLKEDQIQTRVAERLACVALSGFDTRLPSGLSGGQKKRVGVARATITQAPIVLYDEPAAGLDPVTSQKIFELLRAEQRASGATVLMVSSDLPRLLTVTDRVGMMYRGQLIFDGTTHEAQTSTEPRVKQFVHGLTEGPL